MIFEIILYVKLQRLIRRKMTKLNGVLLLRYQHNKRFVQPFSDFSSPEAFLDKFNHLTFHKYSSSDGRKFQGIHPDLAPSGDGEQKYNA